MSAPGSQWAAALAWICAGLNSDRSGGYKVYGQTPRAIRHGKRCAVRARCADLAHGKTKGGWREAGLVGNSGSDSPRTKDVPAPSMKIQAALAFAWFIRNSLGFRELRTAVRESGEPGANSTTIRHRIGTRRTAIRGRFGMDRAMSRRVGVRRLGPLTRLVVQTPGASRGFYGFRPRRVPGAFLCLAGQLS